MTPETTVLPENLQRIRDALPNAIKVAQGNSPYVQAIVNLRDGTNFVCDGLMALGNPMPPNSGIALRIRWNPHKKSNTNR